MKVVVDNKIPYIKEAIETIANEVVFAPGKDFAPRLIKDADALIIRTRTLCNRALLEGSNVQFIATATIGYDHIDTVYCREAGIRWTNAPGCNANSVAEYIESSLILLKARGIPLHQMTMGVVGVGNVGKLVARKAKSFGMRVLLNDPPRAEKEGNATFSSLKEITEQCDIITFHTPLIKAGKHSTYHLADEKFFASLKRKCVIINTSRGEVVDNQALLNAMNTGKITNSIIDVWENEPHINLELLDGAFIATPHIAGYSADGKANATRMSLEALCAHFGIQATFHIAPPPIEITPEMLAAGHDEKALLFYNPMRDTEWLKHDPQRFEEFRNDYPLRREMPF